MAESESPAVTPSGGEMVNRRLLLKISGEALMGGANFGISAPVVDRLATELQCARSGGIELGIVIGGGNIFRGLSAAENGLDRVAADQMGMLATVMNALAMQTALERLGEQTRVLSAIPMDTICEPYIKRRAMRHLEKGRIVIFAAGTGNPFFTTDTAAVLRAVETGSVQILKGTNVDGVYDSDPRLNPGARRYDTLSQTEALARNLKVMDSAALAVARDNGLPIRVFNLSGSGAVAAAVRGTGVGTTVTPD